MNRASRYCNIASGRAGDCVEDNRVERTQKFAAKFEIGDPGDSRFDRFKGTDLDVEVVTFMDQEDALNPCAQFRDVLDLHIGAPGSRTELDRRLIAPPIDAAAGGLLELRLTAHGKLRRLMVALGIRCSRSR